MNGDITLAALCHCQRAIDLVCIITSDSLLVDKTVLRVENFP